MKSLSIHREHNGTRRTPHKYEAMKAAMLAVLPESDEGMAWEELVQAVAPLVPAELFPHLGSVRWYSKAVQLDLEARGVIARFPKRRPLRLRRLPAAGTG